VWQLRSVDWLHELSVDEIGRLRGASVYREYGAGETICAPETHPRSLYLLERGLVRIYRISIGGTETSFGYVTSGEVFGEMAAFGDYPRESYAQAVRPSRVWRISGVVFRSLLVAQPELGFEIARQIATRLKRVESRVENLVFRDARARVANILLELASDFGRTSGGRVAIEVDISQGELATLVGSTRQTINATLREFEREGWLGREGRRLVLLEPEPLRRIAETPARG
jgi:CRP-like cAMP-binding protein